MRLLILIALASLACSGEGGAPEAAPSAPTRSIVDPLVLRVPRSGGTGRVYQYPKLDSVIFRSAALPAVTRVLAFDPDAGSVALVTSKGVPMRLDLRLNETHVASRAKLTSLASADGSDIYGVTAKNEVVRLDPSGSSWSVKVGTAPPALVPEPDGSILIANQAASATRLELFRPPDTTASDTVDLPSVGRAVRTRLGDRIYFTSENGLVGVAARDLSVLKPVSFKSPITALAPTPSGDRLYVATLSEPEIAVLDRYSQRIVGRLKLPVPPRDLRMDPLGRYLLARNPDADSAWVIAIGSDRVIGSVPTAWTADLPAVAPDGAVVLLGRSDVTIVDGETLHTLRVVKDGAKDFWYFFYWDGFRPRAAGVDQPVNFDTILSRGDSDSLAAAGSDSAGAVRDSIPPTAPPQQPQAASFVVSFAAVLNEQSARTLASQITINGASPRVVAVTHGSSTVYRVVLGPYATRDEADRVGRSSGRQYWVYEGAP